MGGCINEKERRAETADADKDQFCVMSWPASEWEGDSGRNPLSVPVAHQGT